MEGSRWLVWQLIDSAFPAGGFAHSGGLEAVVQHGWGRGDDGLRGVLAAMAEQNAAMILPFVYAAARQPGSFASLDGELDLVLNNHVANRASRAQGGALLAAARRIVPAAGVGDLHAEIVRIASPTHLPTTFGAVSAALGIEPPTAAQMFAFQSLRTSVSAAVRLGVVGPMEGQRLQLSLSAHAAILADRAAAVCVDDVVQIAPLADLLQGTHDRLYSRLFQS